MTDSFYPDCSNNNWGSTQDALNFVAQLIPEGFAGMCHKVSEGNYYEDPYWQPVLQASQEAGLAVIGYHYVTTDDPASQAETWLGNNGGPVAMFDWEANGGNVANYFAVAEAFAAVGVTVVLGYCPQWYWEEVGEGDLSAIPVLVSSAYPTAAAGYASSLYASGGGDSGEGWDSYGNATPQVWQFTDAALIAGLSVDCNVAKDADLQTLFGQEPTMTPEQAAQLTAVLAAVQDIQIQLRGIPGPNGTFSGWPQLGQNPDGENLTVVDALADVKDGITLQPTEGQS
jgi:hypothetical protein